MVLRGELRQGPLQVHDDLQSASQQQALTLDNQKTKRTVLQVIFAEDWLAKAWIGGSVLATTTGLTARFLPTFQALGFSIDSALLAFAILSGGLIAYFLSLILGSCVLPPVYRTREKINGAPFKAGDVVEILKKPHRGQVAQVISGGDPKYGATVSLSDSDNASETLNFAWYSIRKLAQDAESGGGRG